MSTLNSNMASEFLVMSTLYRLGLSPILTLGNKKDIDIIIHHQDGYTITIDVKGLKGITNWPIGTKEKLRRLKHLKNHFFVFVSYRNHFLMPSEAPEIYIVPVRDISLLVHKWPRKNQYVVYRRELKQNAPKYQDNWGVLTNRH